MRAIVNFGCIAALAMGQVASLAPAMAQTREQRPAPGNWNNNNNNFNGQTVRCESRGNNRRECRADTRGGVRLNRVLGGQCRQGRDWGWRDGMIWVDNGCRGEFITGGFGGSGNNNNNDWNNNNGNWSGNTIRCESRNYSYRECRADTRGGVRLVRVLGGSCPQNRNWGWRNDVIWVDNGCRADFQTRNGNNSNNNNSGGSDAALIIGGVAVAAGLAALIASSNNSKKPAATPGAPAAAPPATTTLPAPANGGRPATVNVSTGGVTPDARPSLQTCLTEVARQIGATGGTEIRLGQFDEITAGNGGFRFRMQLIAVYPDETRTIPTFCRATPTSLIELTFG